MSSEKKFPKPRVRRVRWPFPILWMVPMLAAVGAGIYYWGWRAEQGPEVVVTFRDVEGIRVEDTPVLYRGVNVGKVIAIELAKDLKRARVRVRLVKGAEGFAKEGSLFWVVRPVFTAGSLSGLGTVISGPYIEAWPGDGKEREEMAGLDVPPIGVGQKGLEIVLHAGSVEHLQPNSGVFYKGVQVGVVKEIRMNGAATGIDVRVLVWKRYEALVRTGSVFWSAPGAEVEGGLLSGVNVKLESLGTLIAGAIAFATPEPPGDEVKAGAEFALNREAKKEWAEWRPVIAVDPAPAGNEGEAGNPAGDLGK